MSAEALLEQPDLFEEPPLRRPLARMFRLCHEFLDLAEHYPSPLKPRGAPRCHCGARYPPTKSHLFKMLHRLIGVDQAETRRKAARQEPLTRPGRLRPLKAMPRPQEEMKLELMCCPVKDFAAIRKARDLGKLASKR